MAAAGRRAIQWFSYDLPVNGADRWLDARRTYNSDQRRPRSFDVLVNGTRSWVRIAAAEQPVASSTRRNTRFPADADPRINETMTVRFEATNGLEVTPVFGVRLDQAMSAYWRRRARRRDHLDARRLEVRRRRRLAVAVACTIWPVSSTWWLMCFFSSASAMPSTSYIVETPMPDTVLFGAIFTSVSDVVLGHAGALGRDWASSRDILLFLQAAADRERRVRRSRCSRYAAWCRPPAATGAAVVGCVCGVCALIVMDCAPTSAAIVKKLFASCSLLLLGLSRRSIAATLTQLQVTCPSATNQDTAERGKEPIADAGDVSKSGRWRCIWAKSQPFPGTGYVKVGDAVESLREPASP